MLENFLYSVNTVVPIFLVVVLGWCLKNFKVLDASFFAGADKFVFNFALPAMLFLDLAATDSIPEFDVKFISFCCAAIIGSFILFCLIVPIFCKSNPIRGAFIQGAYRSNFAILGSSIVINMFGDGAVQSIAIILPFVVILFNVLAVIDLSIFAPADKQLSGSKLLKTIVLNIIKNPLIISLVLGIGVMLLPFDLPIIAEKSITYISDSTMALALMSLGANIEAKSVKDRLVYSISASLVKTMLLPIIVVTVAILLGFRDVQLGIILMIFASPTAVSSYIMAKNMGSDHDLASQILLFSTVICLGTLFLGIFLIKSFGFI
ncbi:MAG: AEC family transporter [Clostridia bacterium]|nr:AEC family transporter [Clostridia bacterium]